MKKISTFIIQMIICGTLTSGIYAQPVQSQYVAPPVQPQYIAPVPIKEKDIQKENKFGFSFDLNPTLTNATIGFDYGMFGISLAYHSNIMYRMLSIDQSTTENSFIDSFAPDMKELKSIDPGDVLKFDVVKILLNMQLLNYFSILCGVDIPINDVFMFHTRESIAVMSGFSFTSKPINQSGFYSSLSFIWTLKNRILKTELPKLVKEKVTKDHNYTFEMNVLPDVFLTIGYKFVI